MRQGQERGRAGLVFAVLAAAMAAAGAGGCWLVKSNGELDGPLDSGAGGSDGAPDGGVADVGAADVHFEAGCDAGNILCEDFEHGLAAYWTPDLSPTMPATSSVTIDGTKPAPHGTHSLHAIAGPADINANGPPIAMLHIVQGTLPMPFYVRFFVWAASGGMLELQPSDSAVASLFEQDAFMDFAEVRATGAASAKKLALANTADNSLAASMTAFPLDSWHCLEWSVTATSMTLSIDGTQLADLNEMTTLKPIIGEEFGWATDALMSFTSTVGQDVWIDEIIISTQPVGCTKFQE